jgi:hypothetical protein
MLTHMAHVLLNRLLFVNDRTYAVGYATVD